MQQYMALFLLFILVGCSPLSLQPQTPTAPLQLPASPLPTPPIATPLGVPTLASVPPSRPVATGLPQATVVVTATALATQVLDPVLAQGLALREIGDAEASAEYFVQVLNADPTGQQGRLASYYLAESLALRGSWGSALALLEPLVRVEAQDSLGQRSLFLLARTYEATDEPARAIAAYAYYRGLATPLEGYAALREAALRHELGRFEEAARLREYAAGLPIRSVRQADAYDLAVESWLAAGQPNEALRVAQTLLGTAEQPAYRAHVLLRAAQAAQQTGDHAQQLAWLQEIVTTAPQSTEAVTATEQLLPLGGIDPAIAASVFATAERWQAAVTQYDAAIAAGGAQVLELRRQRALLLLELEPPDFAQALAELEQVRSEAPPDSDLARQAMLDLIQTRGRNGAVSEAIAGYQAYADQWPTDPRAPEALRRAAVLLEQQSDLVAALEQRRALIQRFPDSNQAAELIFPVALALERAGLLQEALAIYEQQIGRATGVAAAQYSFWAGRARRTLGDQVGADALLAQAIDQAPSSYYAARAHELLGSSSRGQTPVGQQLGATDWQELIAWVQQWAAPDQLPPERASLMAGNGPVARALALDDGLLWADARGEWRTAIAETQDNPQTLLVLAQLAYEYGEHGIALELAEKLLSLAPANTPVPIPLQRLRFPTPYFPAVQQAATEFGVDPLLVYALIRQESNFHPAVESVAGARGLTQVMPATAQGIADRLGIESFQIDDLDRAAVAVRFGAFFLGNQLRQFDQRLYLALAAYNGGPGNAQRWLDSYGDQDADQFVERIDYNETRTYVKRVIGQYAFYQRLYAP